MTAALEVANLAKSFGGLTAVDGVSFHVAEGEMLALIGANGAGKSTTFNLLNGQLKPDRGTIRLFGETVTGLPPRRLAAKGVGRTFQITRSFVSMTVLENIRTGLDALARPFDLLSSARARRNEEAEAILHRVGLADMAARPAAELAYGDLKRLELGIALAGRPRLLLMDEPTAGMAPGERDGLMALARSLVAGERLSVLFTEHDMDVVFGSADRIVVMDRGQVIAEGAPEDVRASERVRAVYLGRGTDKITRDGAHG